MPPKPRASRQREYYTGDNLTHVFLASVSQGFTKPACGATDPQSVVSLQTFDVYVTKKYAVCAVCVMLAAAERTEGGV